MVELMYNGEIIGVFSSQEKLEEYARKNTSGTFQSFPLGTKLITDKEIMDEARKNWPKILILLQILTNSTR